MVLEFRSFMALPFAPSPRRPWQGESAVCKVQIHSDARSNWRSSLEHILSECLPSSKKAQMRRIVAPADLRASIGAPACGSLSSRGRANRLASLGPRPCGERLDATSKTMSDIFHEVDEEVRRDKAARVLEEIPEPDHRRRGAHRPRDRRLAFLPEPPARRRTGRRGGVPAGAGARSRRQGRARRTPRWPSSPPTRRAAIGRSRVSPAPRIKIEERPEGGDRRL